MKKTIVLALLSLVFLALPSCKSPLTPEVAGSAVLQGERIRIPLYIQEYDLKDLTVDSLQFLNTVEPMSAMLYTTWTYDQTRHSFSNFKSVHKTVPVSQTIIIQVDNIQRSKENSDVIQWYSNWEFDYLKMERDIYEID